MKNLIKLSAIGVGGLVTLSLNTPSINEYFIKPVKRAAFDVADANGRTPIFNAILNGDYGAFLDQIELGANVNVRDNSGITLMEIAITKGLSKYFDALIQTESLDLTQLDSEGCPYLYTAISNQRFYFARKLIEKKSKIVYERELLKEMLYFACLTLPENGVALKDRPEQKYLIIQLYFLSNCDRELIYEVLNNLGPHQMDPSFRRAIILTVNDFITHLICAIF